VENPETFFALAELAEFCHRSSRSGCAVDRFSPPLAGNAYRTAADNHASKAGPVSLAKLVKRVAEDLYTEELRKGAGVLDIGLFGGRLFNRDVVRELNAGDGFLWKIEEERDIV